MFFLCVWAWASWWTQHVDALVGELLTSREAEDCVMSEGRERHRLLH
jgi:hypothetical protein